MISVKVLNDLVGQFKVEAIIGKTDEAIINFEKVSGAVLILTGFIFSPFTVTFEDYVIYRFDPLIHMLSLTWMSMRCF